MINWDDIDIEEFDERENFEKCMIVQLTTDFNSLYVIRYTDDIIDSDGELLNNRKVLVFDQEYSMMNNNLFKRIKDNQRIKIIKDDKLHIYIYANGEDYNIDYDNKSLYDRTWLKTKYSDLIKKLNLIF